MGTEGAAEQTGRWARGGGVCGSCLLITGKRSRRSAEGKEWQANVFREIHFRIQSISERLSVKLEPV